jgi:hypothetical protein
MKRFFQEFGVTMIWVFLVLIVGFAILHFVANKFSGNLLGRTAESIGHAAAGGDQF